MLRKPLGQLGPCGPRPGLRGRASSIPNGSGGKAAHALPMRERLDCPSQKASVLAICALGDRADPVIRAYIATPHPRSRTRRAGSKPDTFGADFRLPGSTAVSFWTRRPLPGTAVRLRPSLPGSASRVPAVSSVPAPARMRRVSAASGRRSDPGGRPGPAGRGHGPAPTSCASRGRRDESAGIAEAWRLAGDCDFEVRLSCRSLADLDATVAQFRDAGGITSTTLVLHRVRLGA